MNICERILAARHAYILSGGMLTELVCKMPSIDHEEWCQWIDTIENDPILGYHHTKLREHAFGMDIRLDDTATAINVA